MHPLRQDKLGHCSPMTPSLTTIVSRPPTSPSTGPQEVPGGVRTSVSAPCSPGSDRDPRLWAGTAPHSSPNKSSCTAISPGINTTHVPCQTPSQLQHEKVKTQIPRSERLFGYHLERPQDWPMAAIPPQRVQTAETRWAPTSQPRRRPSPRRCRMTSPRRALIGVPGGRRRRGDAEPGCVIARAVLRRGMATEPGGAVRRLPEPALGPRTWPGVPAR